MDEVTAFETEIEHTGIVKLDAGKLLVGGVDMLAWFQEEFGRGGQNATISIRAKLRPTRITTLAPSGQTPK